MPAAKSAAPDTTRKTPTASNDATMASAPAAHSGRVWWPHHAHDPPHHHLDVTSSLSHWMPSPFTKPGPPAAPHHWPPHLAWPYHPLAPCSPVYATTLTSWAPAADIVETENDYGLEIEVPGLTEGDEDQVLVQWMSPRTVIVSGDVRKTCLDFQESAARIADKDAEQRDAAPADKEGDDLKRTEKHGDAVQVLVSERHSGYWRRSFTLPTDVDFSIDPNDSTADTGARYAIRNGLMTIVIPKAKK